MSAAAESVLERLLTELGLARSEEVTAALAPANEVEVVDASGIGGSTHRRQPGIRDGRRRKTGAMACVVRIVALEIRLLERLGAGHVAAVSDRRVDAQRN